MRQCEPWPVDCLTATHQVGPFGLLAREWSAWPPRNANIINIMNLTP